MRSDQGATARGDAGRGRGAVRRGALAAAVLGACGPPAVVTGPAPSAAVATGPEAPAASSGAASSSGPASGMKPHTGAWLASDVSRAFSERALLVTPRHLRQQRDVPLRLVGGYDSLLSPMAVTVVAHEGEASRVVVESSDVRLLFWATAEAFEPVPVRPQRLALRPGRYPQGPAGMPGRDDLGVWVAPGWHQRPDERRDGWRLVTIEDRQIKAKGWLDESLFGPYFVPMELDSRPSSRGGVRSGSRLLASPAGPVLLALPSGTPSYLVKWFEEVGPAVEGFVHVRYTARDTWVQGLVRASEFAPRAGGGVGWSGRPTVRRGVTMPPARLGLEASVVLYDGPEGEPIGRILRHTEVPDQVDPTPEHGRRRVEIPVGEIGLVPAWVEATALAPLPPPSASGSASAPSASVSAR